MQEMKALITTSNQSHDGSFYQLDETFPFIESISFGLYLKRQLPFETQSSLKSE